MRWLALDWDEGPFFQMQRLDRYREVAEQLIRDGHAYRCYASKEELDALARGSSAHAARSRATTAAGGPRTRKGKRRPAGVTPVVRFRNPDDGEVAWHDLVKGEIRVANAELDDLVLMRADGVPTYNFGVVVDDLDMTITHVIRGDDHVNNTPRQINIYRALGAPLPEFAHVPMILGPDGERLSKRHGAVSVLQYRDDGYLPEALVNYLARLGWSHGDEEMFSSGSARGVVRPRAHQPLAGAVQSARSCAWLNQQYLQARCRRSVSRRRSRRASRRTAATRRAARRSSRSRSSCRIGRTRSTTSPSARCCSTAISRRSRSFSSSTSRTRCGRRCARSPSASRP